VTATNVQAVDEGKVIKGATDDMGQSQRRYYFIDPTSTLLLYCYSVRSAASVSLMYKNDLSKPAVRTRRFFPTMAVYRSNNPQGDNRMFVLLSLGIVRCSSARLDGFLVNYPIRNNGAPEQVYIETDVQSILKGFHVATDIKISLDVSFRCSILCGIHIGFNTIHVSGNEPAVAAVCRYSGAGLQ
jgi:hypothetical protein